ncbi:hypothetical protein BJX70DRAFT_386470 [Aspergillus crustosus]
MASPKLICGNWGPERTECKKQGRYACKNCLLITYCSAECQKSHWLQHRPDCRSLLNTINWQPAWVWENRNPAFVGGEAHSQKGFGENKYVWGNVPAFDLLKLDSNERNESYDGGHRILFAGILLYIASGDLRNIVKTLAHLPSDYNHPIEITVNDRDLDIVARNVIILLLGLLVDDAEKAIDCMIHVWYSALIRQSDLHVIQHQIRPLIQTICEKIKDKKEDALLAQTWMFGQQSYRLVLTKVSWDRLLSFTQMPSGCVTLAGSRKDYRDRQLFCQQPSHRVAFLKFREDGLLLPFGFPRNANTWPMRDSADPLDGWPSEEIAATSTGPATSDIYGKLFFYLRGILRPFLNQVHGSHISFRFFHLDVEALSCELRAESFSRIEVSNISDIGWLGIHKTLGCMVPLLQRLSENPHATLITLFMNAVQQTMPVGDHERRSRVDSIGAEATHLRRYLPQQKIPNSINDPELFKFMNAHDLVTNYDGIFDRYAMINNLRMCGGMYGAVMKDTHTIIDQWPYRLKLRPGQLGAQEEFDRRLADGTSGKERYVEWKRGTEAELENLTSRLHIFQ